MPPAIKRRKTDRVGTGKTTTPVALSLQHGIQAFGKITKPQAARSLVGKSKAQRKERIIPAPSSISAVPDVPTPGRKRKAHDFEEEESSPEDNPNDELASEYGKGYQTQASRSRSKVTARKGQSLKTPRKQTLFNPFPIETHTKGARSYLETLHLSSSPTSCKTSSLPTSPSYTPASSPAPAEQQHTDSDSGSSLPDELQDLINLHSSFLTALSLHYAHHGSLAPVDFRNLRPNIERAWRKRRVSLHDIQQVLDIQQASSSTGPSLSLSDYGSFKVCIEIEAPAKNVSLHKRLLNEESLNKIYIFNLLERWELYRKSHGGAASARDFIGALPLAPVSVCTSTAALAPLLARGQRRLEDLKAGAIKAQARSQPNHKPAQLENNENSSDAENIPPPSSTNTSLKPSAPSLTARKSSLFDRIKAKQEAQLLSASRKTPLTPDQLQRKAALRRIEEIVPVLELLCSGAGVKTFTLATVVQHLQMSLRNPIEKEQATKAVRLLAEDVAPTWVAVKEVGKVVGVTVRGNGMIGGRMGVMGRVRELMNGL